jgi:hypothetical protein
MIEIVFCEGCSQPVDPNHARRTADNKLVHHDDECWQHAGHLRNQSVSGACHYCAMEWEGPDV